MSTRFKKPCSPVFLDSYKQNKTKNFPHTFVDIAKEAACEKNYRKESLLELELLEVFVSLNKGVSIHFVDIANETACKKNQRKEALLEWNSQKFLLV